MSLDPTQVESFRENGFFFPLTVHSVSETADIQARWAEFEASAPLRPGADERGFNRHTDQPWIWRVATNDLILDALEPLIGPDILLFGSRISCKWPGDNSTFAWHQDVSPHKRMFPPQQITAWYAIDGSNLSNGCVRCIPGSHRMGMALRTRSDTPGNVLRRNEENYVTDEQARSAVAIELNPGQASLHDGFTLHMSSPNSSPQRRCGLVLRYAPAAVRQAPDAEFDQRSTAIPVRGYDDYLGLDAKVVRERLTEKLDGADGLDDIS